MPPVSHSQARFRTERRHLVLERIRLVTPIALAGIALAALINYLAFSTRLAEHLATLAVEGALCGGAFLLARRPGTERHALAVALALALGIASAQAWAVAVAGEDADVLLSSLVGIMLFTTLLFPWGGVVQATVSGYVAVCASFIFDWRHLGTARSTNSLIMIGLGVTISVAGAFLLDRQRHATFVERERVAALARQREQLIEAGRALNATIDLDALVNLVVRFGRRLVGCDGAFLTILDERRAVYRTVAQSIDPQARPDPVDPPEIPAEDLAPYLELLQRRGMVELPDPDVPEEVQRLLLPGVRVLAVPIKRDGSLLGILAFLQYAPDPRFSEQARRLAEGFTHQAAIALANAALVEDLRRASRVKSEFVSTMSHELRTPLSVILGFADMAREPSISAAARDEFLGRVIGAGQDLLDLIETTLALGRVDAGREDLDLERVELPALWESLRAPCSRLPREPAVALEWQTDVPACQIVTDPRRLHVVVRNLVGNALKFTTRGHVRVSAAVVGDTLALAVEDTGVGIPRTEQEHVFEMFRQGDSSDARRFGGTGLGLFIVRKYVQMLGGTVELDSEPGRGSIFRLVLPLDATAAQRAA